MRSGFINYLSLSVEGAATGVGLGIDFLKHIARSRVLVYVIDMAGTDNRQPWDDYLTLRREIEQHDAALLERPALVLANKMDTDEAIANLPRFVKKTGVSPLPLSALDPADAGVAAFKQRLWELLKPVPKGTWQAVDVPPGAADEPVDQEADVLSESALRRAPFLDLARKEPKKKKKR